MSNSIIRLGYKDAAWFTVNSAVILEQGQHVYLEQTGTYKIGDGVNDLATLTFLGGGGGGFQSLQDVTDIGATTTNLIEVGGLDNTAKLITLNKGGASSLGSGFEIEDSGNILGYIKTVTGAGFEFLHPLNSFYARFSLGNLTNNRIYILPNNTGTLALTSDIPTTDTTIIDGSTNPVDGNAVFDGLALKADIASPTFTGTVTSPTSAASVNNTNVATTAFVRSVIPFVVPEMYGAVGDGVTNDTTALQNAINSGNAIQLTNGKNYLVTTTLTTIDNTTIIGCGKNASISTTSNIAILSIQGQKNTIKGVTFIGNSTGAAQSGIKIDGNAGFTLIYINNIIADCLFENLLYAGIWIRNIIGSSAGSKNEGAAKISNCIITSCGYGVLTLTRGEYNSVNNCSISSCTTAGVSFTGGNNSITGGNIVNCAIGLEVLTGTNDGHSSANGVMINHNTINFKATHTLGYVLNACMLYAGAVTLTGTGKTSFIGCWFSMSGFNFTQTNSPCLMVDCEMVAVPTNFNLTGTKPILNNCYSGTSLLCYPDRTFASSYTLTANTTIAIPYSWGLESITFRNTTASAVTGGIRVGTTNGGAEVVTAQTVGASETVQILPQDIKKYFFAHNATTTLYIQAVTSWNSANVVMQVKLKQWNNF